MTNNAPDAQSWGDALIASVKSQMATWLITFLMGLLGLFSGQITESVRFALNRADLRTKQYEDLAAEVSAYIFYAELNTEFFNEDWATKSTLTTLKDEYNTSITSLRKKEFVYAGWIKHYWGNDKLSKFDRFMGSVREFDNSIHSLNPLVIKVIENGEQQKIDLASAKEAVTRMNSAIESLRINGRDLLASLD